MSYTVQQLAKLSGVSIRTLRYYDAIGLLEPAYYGENGYRYYEEQQLLRLQEILFFKELGFPLKRIKSVLGRGGRDQIAALKGHRAALTRELERLSGLIQTIDKTVKHIKRESEMEHGEFYEGFSPEKWAEIEEYYVERYGESARENVATAKKRTKNWTEADFARSKERSLDLTRRLARAMRKHQAADSAEVQKLVAEHYACVSQFWTPTKSSYSELGRLYVENEDFRTYYEEHAPQLAEFLARAMEHYAERNLA